MNQISPAISELHSIRLFPKGRGAAGYELTGIAARCDWIVLSDHDAPKACLIKQRPGPPRTVFVSLRQPFVAIEFFFHQVLPKIKTLFVLVTGSEDVTVPTQVDHRWRRFNARERDMLERIRVDARIVAWFAENLDTAAAKMHPLPTGMVPPPDPRNDGSLPQSRPEHSSRPLKVLCCHRAREGDQWQTRRTVIESCRADRSGLCQIIEEELELDAFVRALRQHAFVLCVEGGGLDPSPKAWMAILNGAIPIVRRTPTSEAYRQLPVAFIDDWSQPFLDHGWLESERTRLAPMFDDQAKWQAVQRRLGLDFWWGRIQRLVGDRPHRLQPQVNRDNPLFVVGMHRSGTSLLTALLALCGANPGPERNLTGPNQHNPKGFWENNKFRDINDQLLRDQNCEWDCPLGFSLAHSEPEMLHRLSRQARGLLDSYKESPSWVFKDPRICLTLDFWKSSLPGIVPLLMLRNPVEVASSLFRRNRIPLPIGIALWELYILSAVRQCIDLKPVICNHHDLIYQPVKEIMRLIAAVNGRCGRVLHMPDRQVIENFVDPDLHRETASEDDIRRYLVADQQSVWTMLQKQQLATVAALKLSPASQIALEGYQALGMQFSHVRHLERLDPDRR
jgi:hypothetical protein